jgi:hypothetical protein
VRGVVVATNEEVVAVVESVVDVDVDVGLGEGPESPAAPNTTHAIPSATAAATRPTVRFALTASGLPAPRHYYGV